MLRGPGGFEREPPSLGRCPAKSGFAANGYGDHSPGKYAVGAAFVCEVVMTAMFLIVILGATDGRAAASFAQLFLFRVAPIIGALMYDWVGKSDRD